MKALQIVAPGVCEVLDVPAPEPGTGEVLIEVEAVTTCPHWDIHILGGEPMFPGAGLDYPYTMGQPGHEACGRIAGLGAGVSGFRVRQRVVVWRDRGHHVPGCYAQYVAVDVDSVLPAPDDLPPEACAPLELAMCASAHVMYAEALDVVAGKRVGVFGLGPAGLVFVQLLRAAGAAEVIGFDPLPERRALAQRLGAKEALDPAGDAAARLPRRNAPGCLDTAFDCAGVPAAVHRAMAHTRHLVVLFAVQRVPYSFAPECWSGLTLAGTRPHTREAAEYAAARLADGRIDLGAIVSRRMRLEQYAEAVDLLRQGQALKIAFVPGGD